MITKSLGTLLRTTLTLMLAWGSMTIFHPPVKAASTLTVTNTSDTDDGACDADCSLREAIAAAASGDTIVFDSSLAGQTIILGSQLDIVRNLTIDGSSLSAHIQISGDNAVRMFSINGGVNITLTHLDFASGIAYPDYGGGIKNEGTLTVQNSSLSGNWSDLGGGIANFGILTLQNSTLSGNQALEWGGGIYNIGTLTVQNSTISDNSAIYGGGIYNIGTLTVQNTTLSGNSVFFYGRSGIVNEGARTMQNSTVPNIIPPRYDGLGGGIYNAGTLTMQNSTLSGNSAFVGGGNIYNNSMLNYENTILANSASGGDCYSSGTIGTNNANLVEDGSCSSTLSGDPLLGPLAYNGGATQTHALLPGSPAIDAGDDATCLATDQRGMPRPQGMHCDIGAYERQTFLLYLMLVLR